MLDLKGNTAIYLMYSYARICSIANKAGVQKSDLASVLPSVKVCVCMYVRMFLSLSLSLSLCVCVIWYDKSAQQFRLRPPVCHGVSVYVFTHVCMSVSVCVHACMHACMHVCMHACMYGTVCFGGPLIRTLPAIPAMHTTPKKKIYHLAGGQRSMRCAYTPSK